MPKLVLRYRQGSFSLQENFNALEDALGRAQTLYCSQLVQGMTVEDGNGRVLLSGIDVLQAVHKALRPKRRVWELRGYEGYPPVD